MRIVFMGTAAFAVPSLQLLAEEGYMPIAVATGPDRPRGRGQQVTFTPVKEAALALGIDPILQPESVKDPAFAESVVGLEADVIVVVAYRILPPAVYEAARLGAFNLHGSLLPRYRGAAPIHRAVMAGDTETGVTTFFLEQKVDTGNMILQRSMPIGPEETTGDVHDRMMILGAEAVLDTVKAIEAGSVETTPQVDTEATPAPKIFKDECQIPWEKDALDVHNHIRGTSPFPGAWTTHGDRLLKAYRSRLANAEGEAGCVLTSDESLVVACGSGAVELLEMQQQGRRKMPATDFLKGYTLDPGTLLT